VFPLKWGGDAQKAPLEMGGSTCSPPFSHSPEMRLEKKKVSPRKKSYSRAKWEKYQGGKGGGERGSLCFMGGEKKVR